MRKLRRQIKDPGLLAAVKAAKGIGGLAKVAEVSSPAVSQWEKVPIERTLIIERKIGLSRHVMRPDIFGPTVEAVSA